MVYTIRDGVTGAGRKDTSFSEQVKIKLMSLPINQPKSTPAPQTKRFHRCQPPHDQAPGSPPMHRHLESDA